MAKFIIDPMHSDIEFKIKHLMISTVRGRFNNYEAWMISDKEDFSDAHIECHVDVASIYTSIKDRDDHLRSPDFFNVEKYPYMIFKSNKVESKGDEYLVHGDLTIQNTTKPIVLEGSFNGSDVDHYGQTKYGFELSGTIKRSDWFLDFNIPGGQNTLLIGNDVKLEISIQMIKEA
jgi:polyisoprenoid-binding protein YceI